MGKDKSTLKAAVKAHAASFLDDTIANRRHLHAHPELSYQEKETAAYVAQKLGEYGIPFEENVADTGVVGLIKGNNPEAATFALRADMDALPITEENDVSYKSQNHGVMHACGHDAHTSSLLSAGRILNELKGDFEGTVKLIFQPAEEKFPGGASLMIKEGVLESPAVGQIIGQHVHPPLEAGKVGFRTGAYMAAADEIYLTVNGRGGHAAYPHLTVDPIIISAHILIALQQVVSRNCPPAEPAVLSFGDIRGIGATNVIPDFVKIMGTFRSFNQDMRFRMHEQIEKIAKGTAEAMGASVDIEIKVGYPPLFNHPELTNEVRLLAEEYLGAENVVDLDISLGAEDFAYYSQQTDACFYRLGTRKAAGPVTPIHTATFDIDEQALEIGAGLMAWTALAKLVKQ